MRWSVKVQAGRPFDVLLTAIVLALVVSAAVGASVWMRTGASVVVALGAALLALLVLAGFLWVSWRAAAPVCLLADARGNWLLGNGTTWREVLPLRVWRGPYWITLALSGLDGPGRTTTLTVWRCALAPQDWRTLCILLRARLARVACHSEGSKEAA